MKPMAPPTNTGRRIAGDDVHHRSADVPTAARRSAAKAARHGARQALRAQIRRDLAGADEGLGTSGAVCGRLGTKS